MKKFLDRNSIPFGVILVVVSEVLCALLLLLGLLIAHAGVEQHLRWFAVAFVPPVLFLRYYAKDKQYIDTLKAIATTLFVTLVAFMWYLLKYRYITF